MWRDPGLEQSPSSKPQNVPVTPGNGPAPVWSRLTRLLWRHLLIFAITVGVSFALIYDQMTTRLFFVFDAPRQMGDPCLTLMRPTHGPDMGSVWANFGHCSGESRDPNRETIVVDFRYGLLLHYKTEPLLLDTLPLPLTRVLRNQDTTSRAFGRGGTLSYDMGLVGDLARLSWVDLVLAGGGRVHYRRASEPGWFHASGTGYLGGTALQWTGREWRLQREDGVELLFPESSHATRLEQAALLRMQTADRRALLVVDRDRLGNIVRVSAGGQQLVVEHDALNRVTAIDEASTRKHLEFEYDSTGCLVRQTGSGGVFEYEYDRRNGGCRLRQSTHQGLTFFVADYSVDDRVIGLTDPTGRRYTFSYQTDEQGKITRADVQDSNGTLRRITIDDTGYWFSHWGSYRRR